MRRLYIPLLVAAFVPWAPAIGQNVPLKRLGDAFTQTNIALSWNASTQGLPTVVWTYRALPSKVSATVISNLTNLGDFAAKDRKNVPGYPTTILFNDPTGKKTLQFVPEWTYIYYNDGGADDMHIVEGVPNPEQTFQIATNWLPKLGVEIDQLFKATNGSGPRMNVGNATATLYKKSDGLAYATNTYMREAFFMRTLDGIEVSGGTGRGGCSIQISHHAKIRQIMVSWRHYERDKCFSVASPETILKWIREGKAVWWSPPGGLPPSAWGAATNIVIRTVKPYYYSEGYSEYDHPLNWALPFVELEAHIESAITKQ